jgi:hypothetical protein
MPALPSIAAVLTLWLVACASTRPAAPLTHAVPQRTEAHAATGPAGDDGSGAVVALPTAPLEVRWPDLSWGVAVDLPGFAAAAPQPTGHEETLHVLATDEGGTVASVILRRAAGATAAACRDRDWARIQAGVQGLREARVFERGGVLRATYVVPHLDGHPVDQLNAHAWLAREGICVHVHVSKMQPEPGDPAAMERILGSIRFSETL